jgi:hypothetical protein
VYTRTDGISAPFKTSKHAVSNMNDRNFLILLSYGLDVIRMLSMKFNLAHLLRARPVILAWLLGAGMAAVPARGAVSLKPSAESVECQLDGQPLWAFSFATNQAKPCFHPLRVTGSESLTHFRPSDHKWHYGLWFSWKYINKVNYWEEDKTGHSEGTTMWDAPKITTHKDGSAEINMTLRYVSPSNETMMTEKREIHVSAPHADGGVTIDWEARFTAGNTALLLDRTPMPGEEKGAVNGGYAGFSMRAAQSPAVCEFVTIEGPVTKFVSDRARPSSKAAACNVSQNNRTDGVAILSHTSNAGGDSPWYMVNSKGMHWFSPVLLAPAPKKVKPHETFTWKFRVITRAGAWTPEALSEAAKDYR